MQNLEALVDDWEALTSFVLYRLPGEDEIHFSHLKEDSSAEADHKNSFVWARFRGEENFYSRFQSKTYASGKALLPAINQITFRGSISFELTEEKRSEHLARVEMALEELRTHRLEKVVVSRIVEVKAHVHPLILFWRALERHPKAFCYWFYHPEHGCWLGASPEVLVRTRNQQFETYSLAGTQKKRGDAPPEWTAKERREQAIVTEYLKGQLREKVNEIHVSGPHNAEAGQLWHLKSVLSGLTQVSARELAQSLHPSPAVCGMPASRARRLIAKIEQHDRAYYTGYFGPLGHHQADIFVNLRCLQWNKDNLKIYVGGGITVESDPKKEWQETCDKMQTMLQLLQE